ncbi:DNA-binding protein WhiA [Halanaerobaculum tunisiense]
MSFTDEVKHEVIRKDNSNRCCHLAELAALIKSEGSLKIVNQQLALKLVSQQAVVARKLYNLLQERFDFITEIIVRKKMYLNKDNYYIIKVASQPGVKELLVDCGLIDKSYQLNYQIKEEFKEKECCRQAYLKGLFLATGSLTHPEKEYHLELSIDYQEYAVELKDFFTQFEIDIKLRQRNDNYLLYLKKADDIIKVLNLIGAHSALLQFENARVHKKVRNRVNRLVNCETANLNKTVAAAQRQLEHIELIDQLKGLEELPASLQEIADLRRENPYSSLKELGEMLELTKSGVNHRFRRIKKIAQQLQESKFQSK